MPVIDVMAGPRFVQNEVNQSVVAPSRLPCKVVVVAADSVPVSADSLEDSVAVPSADDSVLSEVIASELVVASELVAPPAAAELVAAVVAAVEAAVGVPAELLPQAARATAAATATPINPVRLIVRSFRFGTARRSSSLMQRDRPSVRAAGPPRNHTS